ncbi:MAG: signal peptidase II [Clostridia bacterium]|nr:signal peptidase II [Clostridia bacterium]
MTIVLIAIIAGIICLDQVTKWLAVVFLQGEASFPLWREVLHFTYAENTGMAFGMLKDHRWVFMVFSTLAIIGLAVYLFRYRPEGRWMQISMAFIIGGGIGNMIDRIFLGYVVDFIDFTLIDFAIFNVADSFVCVGAGIMIVLLFIDLVKEIKLERAQKAAVAAGAKVEETAKAEAEEKTETKAEEKAEDDANVEQ